MFDIGVTKLAIVGGIALIVIGPEKLPGLAKTLGTLLGRARRYVADVKEEVNRSIDLDELRKMKDTMETAAQAVETSIQTSADEVQKTWTAATYSDTDAVPLPYYSANDPPKKRWRSKISATPKWYKARSGTRTKALSGAARVARFRPPKVNP
ncbi:MAG: Sec-independent protein translocase protein TatB [Rhodoferax sp.]|nr:Sec-independent protein translocase protein TatB [Rhodoferax sp.]